MKTLFKKVMDKKELLMGGQAIINGVLMKSPKKISIAVRNPRQRIIVKTKRFSSLTKRKKILGLPFIRGIIVTYEMLAEGIGALNYSAQVSLGLKKEQTSTLSMVFSFLVALGAALILFKFVPLLIIKVLGIYFPFFQNSYMFVTLEGIIKIGIFILYVYLISLSKEIRTVFMYHGAEHKTIFCYENKKALTKENIRKFSTKHPRCGTSFIFFVLFLSILLYSFIPLTLPFWKMYLYRIVLLPVLAGISYELLKCTSRFQNHFLFKVLSAPGILIQYITTKEPTDDQIDVAIAALKKAA